MTFSILISGLIERIDRLLPLYYELLRQARGQEAEVLVLVDNRVAMPLEAKRNRLLAASKGRFVAFVDDDDDWVAEDYVSAIIDMARQQPDADVICFQQCCARNRPHTIAPYGCNMIVIVSRPQSTLKINYECEQVLDSIEFFSVCPAVTLKIDMRGFSR